MEGTRITAEGGSFLIADTTARTAQKAYAFIAQEDTVIATLLGGGTGTATDVNHLTNMGLSGKTIKQGALFMCPINQLINSITLTSGSIIIYKPQASTL